MRGKTSYIQVPAARSDSLGLKVLKLYKEYTCVSSPVGRAV